MVPRPTPQSSTTALIPDYFSGREVFITGATGFMGKVLVERLLWTCPEISRLHLLMRCKKDVPPGKRLKELKQSQVFDNIREHCPQQLDKLSVVAGDLSKENFSLDAEGFQQLSQVTVVFHSAATVKFYEPLPMAVEQNVRSVLTLMEICDQLPMIKVLVYVSTAYSNAELSNIEERVYPAPANLHKLLVMIDNIPQDILAEITPKLISPKPNTYTFTKAMAESVVADRAHSASYATAIFRPTIVISSLKNPFPGWIENFNGPSGVMVGVGKGLLHTIICTGHKRADMIPVDIAIDTLIAVAWEAGIDDSREARVYNCSSYDNPTTWDQFRERMMRGVCDHPFDSPLWYPFGFYTRSEFMLKLYEWLFQIVPLHTIDFLYTTFGIKQRFKLSTASYHLRAMNDATKYFLKREWKISTNNVKRLRDRLAVPDTDVYNLNPHSIDWEAHCIDFVKGTRKYLLKESDKNLQKAQLRIRILYVLHRATQCLIAFFLYRAAVVSSPAILKIVFLLMTIWRKAYNISTRN